MKVLLVNGSARVHGNTATALQQIAQTLETEDIDTQIFQLGAGTMRDSIRLSRERMRPVTCDNPGHVHEIPGRAHEGSIG